jgi:hypothetical protein
MRLFEGQIKIYEINGFEGLFSLFQWFNVMKRE